MPLLQRKLSRTSSNSKEDNQSSSLWPRRSRRKSRNSTSPDPSSQADPPDTDQEPQQRDPVLTFPSRSIIPDPLGELPAWFKKESDMAAANMSSFRIKYPLHNPQGPRWYRNHHLIPPSERNPDNRPSSVFSPSFPPMAASVHDRDRVDDPGRHQPGPSRSPSSTPLPTPSSSQVRIADPTKPRSRKASQDNVDMLDVSDPWGTTWHHQSPYDAGTPVTPSAPDPPEGSRSRLSSINAPPGRHKTVTPSPLSQSTSALHLQVQEPTAHTVPRKLSKRRKPVLGSLFHSESNQPADDGPPSANAGLNGLPRRHSTIAPTVPPYASSAALSIQSTTTKAERRGSVLGRLVRKFSVFQRPTQGPAFVVSERAADNIDADGDSNRAGDRRSRRRSILPGPRPPPEHPEKVVEKRKSAVSSKQKRVPPPALDPELAAELESSSASASASRFLDDEKDDHHSLISFDPPEISPIGQLRIANPDAPSSGAPTPVKHNVALPADAPSPVPVPEVRRLASEGQEDASPPQGVSTAQTPGPPPPPKLPPQQDQPHRGIARVNAVQSPPAAAVAFPPPTHPVQIPPRSSTSPTQPSHQQQQRSPPNQPSSSRSPPPAVNPPPISSAQPSGSASAYPRPTPPWLMTADDSPLSRASILANPPTPYSVTEPTVELPAVEKAATSATRAGAGATNGVGAEKVAPRESDPGRAISPSSKRAAARENGGPRDREVESLTLSKRAGERVSVVGRDRDRESSPTKKAAAPVQEEARLVKSASASGKKAESRGVGRKTSDRAAAAPAAPVVPVANGVSAQAYVSNSPDAPRRRRTKDKAEKYERVERADREREREKERADRAERAERSERRERERERGERYYERSERYYERGERTERERGERSERAERSDRTERERAKSGRDREREREREREKERERDRDRERYRERDRDSKRDSRRESRREQYDVADSRRRVTSQGAHQTPADDGNRYSRGRGADVPQPQPQPRAGPSSREKPRSPIRDEDFQPYYPSGVRNSVASSQLDSAHAARPVSNVYTTSTHERMSTSGRPTSELPPASELNAFRAREHWEMDRLWKGRSMYQGQPETTVIASPQSVVGAQLTNGDARNHHASITAHGSNHTAYVVQPLQAHAIPANMFYANMPSAPPPIIYAATSPPGQLPQQHYQQQQQQHASRPEFTSLPSSFVFPSKDTAAAAASPTTTSGGTSGSPPPRNPLPPPPRESNYQAAPLPDYSGSASEYWTKHASVTTH